MFSSYSERRLGHTPTSNHMSISAVSPPHGRITRTHFVSTQPLLPSLPPSPSPKEWKRFQRPPLGGHFLGNASKEQSLFDKFKLLVSGTRLMTPVSPRERKRERERESLNLCVAMPLKYLIDGASHPAANSIGKQAHHFL